MCQNDCNVCSRYVSILIFLKSNVRDVCIHLWSIKRRKSLLSFIVLLRKWDNDNDNDEYDEDDELCQKCLKKYFSFSELQQRPRRRRRSCFTNDGFLGGIHLSKENKFLCRYSSSREIFRLKPSSSSTLNLV